MSTAARTLTGRVAEAFRAHERLLWGLAYRMTGSAADADDVVQDTFARAMEHPPPRVDEPLRPWLVHVAMNVARDSLRRRRRRAYVGPWLPAPIEGEDGLADAPGTEPSSEARYERRESASYAFLLALEALSPPQRAVLLLRDVLDYSVRETAVALGLSEINVKVIHHRARRAMTGYDRMRRPATAQVAVETAAALQRFLAALMTEDAAGLEACLAEGVRLVSDGGGEYRAALKPVVGRGRVARFFLGLQRKLGVDGRFEVRMLNGLPAVVAEYAEPRERWAPRFVLRCEVDASGGVREVHIVAASRKMTAIGAV